MSSTCRRGVSLAETLLTAFILVLVLGVVSTIIGQYAQVARFNQKREVSGEMRRALTRVRSELMSATQIVQPPAGGGPSALQFFRVDPGNARDIPANLTPTPNPLPGTLPWDPRDPAYLALITYDLVGDRLVRTPESPPGTVVSTETLCDHIVGFDARNSTGRILELRGTVREETRLTTHTQTLTIGPGVDW